MNVNLPNPPALTGGTGDTKKLSLWCAALTARLKQLLYRLDGENISALPPEKLGHGEINIDQTELSGLLTSISGSGFSVVSPDGTQYIKLEDGKIYIAAQSVSSAS